MARLPVCVMLAIVGTVEVSGTASAQLARYPRQQPAPPPAVLSERVKPPAAKPAVDPSAAAKPAIDADAVLSIESLRGAMRIEQEQILVQLIENTPDSEVEEKSDYYFRLGELYAKQHRFWRMKSIELAANQKEAVQASNKAKEFLLKTVKTYKGLTDNDGFRNYPKMDMALFYYAYTLQGGKYMKEARSVYDKLLKNYPNSKYVPEAHLAFGDYFYDVGQLADAEARYKKVLEFPTSSVYPYALYKLGWVHLQLAKPQDAAETFFKVIAATRADSAKASLYRAAKSDFVRAYAAAGKPERAFDVFRNIDKSGAIDLSELLADLAREGGAPERALTVYRDLVSRARGDARACSWQYRIASTTLSMPGANTVDKIKEVDALVHMFAAQKEPDDECRANAAAMSGELAAAYYAEWSKTLNSDTLGYAEQLYSIHVAAFPDDEAERAQYAEVLWARADHETNAKVRRERWKRTAEMFTAVATPEAARAAALAWMNALDIAMPADAKVTLGKSSRTAPRALPIPAVEAKLIAAVTAYEKQGPADDDELAQMRLAAAMTWRRYRHFDEAATMLDVFLEHHQTSAHAELAANLLLDAMIQRGKLDEALEVVDAIAADHSFVDGKPELLHNIQLLRSRSLRAAR
ncbi:MAG TPA: tetratricopeptide repeat protein [Kofleriaceae bacterium]|nr:tetratricopeptide repeat protein [Kofleriaceae bacterium]